MINAILVGSVLVSDGRGVSEKSYRRGMDQDEETEC